MHRSHRFATCSIALLGAMLVSCSAMAHGSHDHHHDRDEGKDELVRGWLSWRGPNQNGTTDATDLPDRWEVNGTNHRWTRAINGRGTPVIGNGRMYVWGYRGEGSEQREVLACLNAETGRRIWEHEFPDFLSDHIYSRYSIGAPTIDPETGNIYLVTSPGLVMCLSPDGDMIWQHSTMEAYGRLTFPNGRVGAPVIDRDNVIIHCVTGNWGKEGPPRDRFYAFDKRSGDLVWSSTPGVGPPFLKDSSFATPVLDWYRGARVFYAGTGCGNVVCVNASTGEPIWRTQFLVGGVNSSVLLHDGKVIAIHGKENIDSSEIGRMAAWRVNIDPAVKRDGPELIGKESEVWRNPLGIFTSSPTLVGNRIYQMVHTGELHCVDAKTGEILWELKLSTSQLHASPLYGDGKLYVPMVEGDFYIVDVSGDEGKILSHVKLEGSCLGSPAYWNGKIYVLTTEKLYCFGEAREKDLSAPTELDWDEGPKPGEAVRLQVVPAEVLVRPGAKVDFQIYKIDAKGNRVGKASSAKWSSFIPPTAKVRAEMDAGFNDQGQLVVPEDAKVSAGAFMAKAEGLAGVIRGRVLPDLPISEDFESFELSEDSEDAPGSQFAYPPLPWVGARFKWEIREVDGTKALTKTTSNLILQRAMSFIGHPETTDYTIQADVMTDRARRLKGVVGVINQRYIIALKASHNQVEVVSNYERLHVTVPFPSKANTWYTIKARVDTHTDGSGTVLGKVWERGTEEPADWTIRADVPIVHKRGAPGLFGFSPQNRVRVYIDNIKVTRDRPAATTAGEHHDTASDTNHKG